MVILLRSTLTSSIFNSLVRSINPDVGIPYAKSTLYIFIFCTNREEIINQASVSFKSFRKSYDIGFFYGDNKETERHSCEKQNLKIINYLICYNNLEI